jgi:hypothetical protein
MYTYNCFGRENHGHLTDRDAVECREEQEYNAAPPHCPWHDIDLDELEEGDKLIEAYRVHRQSGECPVCSPE